MSVWFVIAGGVILALAGVIFWLLSKVGRYTE